MKPSTTSTGTAHLLQILIHWESDDQRTAESRLLKHALHRPLEVTSMLAGVFPCQLTHTIGCWGGRGASWSRACSVHPGIRCVLRKPPNALHGPGSNKVDIATMQLPTVPPRVRMRLRFLGGETRKLVFECAFKRRGQLRRDDVQLGHPKRHRKLSSGHAPT